MRTWILLVIASAAISAAGCSSNSNAGCSTKNGTTLATTAWPKFRNDLANTGRTEIEVQREVGDAMLVFPRDGSRIGTVATTPILDNISRCSKSQEACTVDLDCPTDEACTERDRIVIAATDSSVYILNSDGLLILDQPIDTAGSITATPLLGADGTLFVASGDGRLRQYRTDGTIRRSTTIGGFLSGSPTIGSDGSIYQGSLGGLFTSICHNGAARFTLGTAQVQSTAAVIPDPEDDDPKEVLALFAVDTGLVRAVDKKGRERWSLNQPSAIGGAVVVDERTDRFFVAQTSGRVSAGNVVNGLPDNDFHFQAAGPITASMALGSDDFAASSLYVADQLGTLYSLDRATGAVRWTYAVGAPIRSSPAVSTGGERDVVVFGADDGFVYAVQDDGSEPALLWAADVGPPIGQSSPSIGPSGAVFIGTEDVGNGGALFLIGEL